MKDEKDSGLSEWMAVTLFILMLVIFFGGFVAAIGVKAWQEKCDPATMQNSLGDSCIVREKFTQAEVFTVLIQSSGKIERIFSCPRGGEPDAQTEQCVTRTLVHIPKEPSWYTRRPPRTE